MKTTLQKLVVSLLVLVMFLTSNGTLVLAAEINDVVDANNDVAIENVTEALETDELTQVDTNEDEPIEGLTNEQDQVVVEEKENVEETVAVDETDKLEEIDNTEDNVQTETTLEPEVNTNDTIDVNESVETIEENITIVETKNETIFNEDTITFTGNANNVDVKVVAQPGTFPVGTTMVVTPVEKTEVINAVEAIMKDEVNDVKAVDISFYANGEEVEPSKNVNVELNTSALKAEKDLNVVHIQDSGKIEVMDLTKASKTTTEFKAESFSVYVVVDVGENARLNVKFMNGTSEIASMYVKKADITNNKLNEIVYDPGAGSLPSNVIFKGWTKEANYKVDAEGNVTTSTGSALTPMTITDVRNDVTSQVNDSNLKDGTVANYYAILLKTYKINYLDDNGTSLGGKEIYMRADEPEGKEQSYTIQMAYTTDSEHNFEGWTVQADSQSHVKDYAAGTVYKNDTTITVTGDVTFKVSAPKGNWLVFDENGKGATYNAPQFVLSGTNTSDQTILPMRRNGYTFDGWYTDAACTDGNEFEFGYQITTKTTIYAKWTAVATAPYTVLIWKQNLACDGYDFETSILLRGNTDSTVNTVSQQGTGDNAYARVNGTNYQYTGFHLKQFDTNKTIAPEGNTVVNVYYDRTEYTLTFRRDRNGTVYKTITAKYGQNIADNFPITTNGASSEWRWDPQNSNTFNQVLVYIDIMPAENVTFYRNESSASMKYMELYVEILPGETPTRTFNGKSFKLLGERIPAKYNFFTEAEDFINLSGYNHFGSDPAFVNGRADVSANGTIRLYYTRKQYSINFMDGKYFDGKGNPINETDMGQISVVNDIVYQSTVSSYNNYKPSNDKTPEGYVFDGWYIDDECSQKYTFDKMPDGGITVYAKWIQEQYRVFLHPNVPSEDDSLDWGSSTQEMNFRVDYGGQISTPTGLREDYEMIGWYTDPDLTNIFNDALVLNSSTVTADYDKTADFTDPMDKYGLGATTNADVNRFWITKKFDLYAKWRAKLPGADGIKVIYDAAEGSNAPTDNTLYADQANASAASASTAPTNKYFDSWEVQKWNGSAYVGTGIYVHPGETFEVLKDNSKIEDKGNEIKEYTVQLKAVYKDISDKTTTHIYWYLNDGTAGYTYADNDIDINAGVDIKDAPSRNGYTFKGWAKVDEPSNPTTYVFKDNTGKQQLLFYNTADSKYYREAAFTNEAKQVAADEVGYEALIALWEGNPDQLTYDANGGTGTMNPTEGKVGQTIKVSDNEFTKAGYTFTGWNTLANPTDANPGKAYAANDDYVLTPEDDIVYAQWSANTNTKYTVNHHKQNIDNDEYTLAETENKTGTTDTQTQAQAKTYTGFTAQAFEQKTIAGDESTVVDIYYNRNTYTITYNITGTIDAQDNYAQQTYKYEATVTAEAKPEKEGYTFVGWTGVPATMPAQNVVAEGHFEPNKNTPYKVEHYQQNITDDGFTLKDTQNLTGTTDTTVTATPNTYEGFTFDESVDGTLKSGTIAANGSLVLKLYYTRNKYKVTYEYKTNVPGQSALPAEATYKFGANVSIAPHATAPGYTFTGWDRTSFTMPAKDVVIKGDWTANPNTEYKAEHYLQNLNDNDYTLKDTETLYGTTNTTTNAVAKTYPGFTAQAFEQKTIAGDGSTVVKIYYNRNEYKITYNITGTIDAQDNYAQQTYKYEATVTAEAKPEKEGYTFVGWTGVPATMPAKNVVAEGHFEPNTNTKYTVKHHKQNIENDEYTLADTDEKTGTTDAKTEAQANTYTGFTAQAFNQETIAADGSTVVNIYYNRNEYKITYNITGKIDAQDNYAQQTYKYEASVTAEAKPEKEGYTFVGWTGVPAKMPANDVVAEGHFEPNTDTKYTVNHHKQNIENDEYTLADTDEMTGTTDAKTEAKAKTYTGFTAQAFNQETIAADGSTVVNIYYNRNEYKITYNITGKIDAQDNYAQQTYKYEASVTAEAKPEKEGYTFVGWTGVPAKMPANDVVAEGHFEANTNTPYKVEHYIETEVDQYELKETENLTGTTDTTATATPKDYEDYTFNKDVEGTIISGNIAGNGSLVLKLYYDKDVLNDNPKGDDDKENGDDIPDKFQIVLNYKVENGKWDDETTEAKVDVVTLLKDGKPSYEEGSEGKAEIPAVGKYPNDGFCAGEWDKEIPDPVLKSNDGETYTYKFEPDVLNDNPKGDDDTENGDGIPDKYQIVLNYEVVNGKWDDETTTAKVDVVTLLKDGKPSEAEDAEGTAEIPAVGKYPNEGYCAGEWDKEIPNPVKKSNDGNKFVYTYEIDKLNDDPDGDDDPENGDGIPDKYQIVLNYEVVNGKWDDETTEAKVDVVTLLKDGKPSEAEDAEGTAEIPAVGKYPNDGYCAGEWDKEIPDPVKKSNDENKFVYTYEIDKLNDDPDGDDDPENGDGIPDKYQIVINYEVENGAWDDTTTEPKVDVITLYKDGELSDAEDAEGEIEIPEVGHEPNIGYWTGDWDSDLPETVKKADNENLYVYTYVICTPTQDDPPVRKVIFGDEPATSDIFKFTLSAISNTAGFDVMPMPVGSNGQSKTVEIKGAGEYEFGLIEFTMPGTYIYQIIEEDTGNKDYVYDESVYEVIYVVSQNEDKLECARTMRRDGKQTDQDAVFMNKYTAPVSNIEVSENPRTGDSIYLYIVMLVVSTFGIVISAIENPKRRKNYSK